MEVIGYKAVCLGFAWLGQPLYACDRCGNPLWFHSHQDTMRNGRKFRRIIPASERESCREKWEPTMIHEGYIPRSQRVDPC